jgi:hypothetical protein
LRCLSQQHCIPGYTTQLLEKLAKYLNLNVRSEGQKVPGKSLGNLRITHLLNEDNGKELTFYELTWSEITRMQASKPDTRLEQWLVEHEYKSVNQLKGSVSQQHAIDPSAYERANYVQVLDSYSSLAGVLR